MHFKPFFPKPESTDFRLTLAHQYFDQLDSETRSAIFGNVGTLIQFRVGNDDAALLDETFNLHTPNSLTREEFLTLANGQALSDSW